MRKLAVILGIFLALTASPLEAYAKRPKILAVNDVVPGTKAIGFSVFRGVEPEPFDVVLGEPNDQAVPGRVMILARISGGPMPTPLEITGIIGGMSGSPVFINCKKYQECLDKGTLVGVLSYSFISFPQKGMNAGNNPSADMFGAHSKGFSREGAPSAFQQLPTGLKYALLVSGPPEFAETLIAKQSTFMSSGAGDGGELAKWCTANVPRSTLKPGSMIKIEFARGGVSVSVWGTITWVDGDDIWAFGHGISGQGAVEFPFVQIAVAETFQTPLEPFKLAGCRLDTEGVITQDTSREIAGAIRKRMALMPLTISLRAGEKEFSLREEIVPQTPFANQLTAVIASYWTAMQIGTSSERTFAYEARIVLKGQPEILLGPSVAVLPPGIKSPPLNVLFGQIYTVLETLKNSGFPYTVEEIRISAEVISERRQIYVLERATLSKYTARPGETVDLTVFVREFPDGKIIESPNIPITVPTDFFERLQNIGFLIGQLPPQEANQFLAASASSVIISVQSGQSFDDKRLRFLEPPRNLSELVFRIKSQIASGNRIYIQYALPPITPRIEGSVAQTSATQEVERKKASDKWQEADSANVSVGQKPPQPVFEIVVSPPIPGYLVFANTTLALRVEPPLPPPVANNSPSPPVNDGLPPKKKSFWRKLLPF